MTTRQIQTIVLTAALAAGMGLVFLLLPGQSQAQGGDVGAQAAVGTAFTYQGQLMYNGSAVNGTCDLTFRLYDAAVSGTQVGGNVYKTGVQVSNGYFSVDLDFGSSAFTGEARFLQITIDSCSGGASGVPLSPMVELKPAPYALSLRPGAVISGTVSGGSGLKVINSGSGDTDYGLYGESMAGLNSAGVYGKNTGSGNGVYGESTDGANGVGVYGKGGAYGVYSNGNAHVEGQLTWKTITSYLSIPAAAFNPTEDGKAFFQNGNYLLPNNPSPAIAYLAPVQLPHGATITRFTFYWRDYSSNNGDATLTRVNLTDGNYTDIAYTLTSGSSGSYSSSSATLSTNNTVDNSQYAYYIWLNLPDSAVSTYGVVIEYTIDRPY